jgi:iron complex outermembrane recepter protein
VLPSFNVEANISDTQKVRLGAARVEAPMDLYSLGVGNSYNFTRSGSSDTFTFANGSSGNPNLDPYRATQTLVSYENYFAKGGLVQVEGFWKQIDSFVETQNVPTVVQGTEGNVNEPVNAGSGRVYGFVLGGQYALDSTPFRGFGVAANYTLSQSTSTQATAYSSHAGIPGVAHDAFTVQAYYERYGFSGRLSYSYQGTRVNDSLVGATFPIYDAGGHTQIRQVFAAAYGQLDAQVSYDITSHFGVVVSAQNLTDEAAHTYLQFPNQPFTYDDWGRRYFFGVKFKL